MVRNEHLFVHLTLFHLTHLEEFCKDSQGSTGSDLVANRLGDFALGHGCNDWLTPKGKRREDFCFMRSFDRKGHALGCMLKISALRITAHMRRDRTNSDRLLYLTVRKSAQLNLLRILFESQRARDGIERTCNPSPSLCDRSEQLMLIV